MSAAMQEDFEEADDAGIVDLDARVAHRADGDRQGEALQEREVDVDVEPLCLETGEAVGDVLEAFADGLEMVQPFLEAEIDEVVGHAFVAQKGRELFVLLQEGVFEIGAEGMMTMFYAVNDGGELAAHLAVEARAEDFGDLVGGEAPQPELAAALEQLVDRETTFEEEVAAVLDLGDRVKA